MQSTSATGGAQARQDDGYILKYRSSIPSKGRAFRKYYRATTGSNGCCEHLSADGGVEIAAWFKERQMLHHHFRESSHTMIERPLCPKCQIRMMLLGVEFSLAGPGLRTFECPQCALDYKALAEDPMKSNTAVGWIKSELRPPE